MALHGGGPLGLGKPVGNARTPSTAGAAGEPFAVAPEPSSTACGGPAGHRLAVVVDTVDPLSTGHDRAGARLTFSSPASEPPHPPVPPRQK
ncbi:hypothetical protein [Streptomyces sp. NPDC014894]|uniref:hypothetical protein n=1 Tax=unclassified Streptomyces TaxID=2593676 RepID=UPI0036F537DE